MSGQEPDMASFQRRITDTRAARKMTLQDVADASGFTKSHVWELERGSSRNPTVRTVWSLASALGVRPFTLAIVHKVAVNPALAACVPRPVATGAPCGYEALEPPRRSLSVEAWRGIRLHPCATGVIFGTGCL